jgi:NAD+ synthetase
MKQITYSKTVENLRKLLRDYILKSQVKSLVIGISGGIDSALVVALAKPVVDELEIPLIGRSISIQTNKEDEKERARLVGNAFCTDFKEIDLTEQYLILREFDDMEGISEYDVAYKIRMGNIKARMRMTYLYNLASKTSGLVLGTENKTEYNLAFFTLHGDSGTDLEPIEGLWKTEVYGMAEYLIENEINSTEGKNALELCIKCNATDGLGISNTDLDQILPDWKDRHTNTRSGYAEVDEIFLSYFETLDKMNSVTSIYEKSKLISLLNLMSNSPVIQRHIKTDFKRNHPYKIKREDIV